MTTVTTEGEKAPDIRRLTGADVFGALGEGWRDFMRAPAFGLFFSLFFVIGGVVIYLQLSVMAQSYWIIPLSVGFPLLGPFAAVGLYDVSRRLEAGAPLDWAAIIGVVLGQRNRQVPSLATVVIILFMFWVFIAHLIFALFFGLKSLTNVMSSSEMLLSVDGLMMLGVGSAVGAVLSGFLFSITVFGLPMLLDREIDFVSAMIASVSGVFANIGPMLLWGVLIVVILFVGMAPYFLGLFIALPVLGHGSWRLYRRAVTSAK